MSATAYTGPVVVFGQAAGGPGSNSMRGPSLFDQGLGLLDPRQPFTYEPGQSENETFYGWLGVTGIPVLDVVPYTATAGAIAAAALTVSGTAMTLASSSADGVTVGASVKNASTGQTVSGLLAIGGAMGAVQFGTNGGSLWDPTKALARAVSVTCNNALGTGGNFTIKGYDIYGYPMTETLTSAPGTALTVTGKKAWKYIASVTPNFTDATYTYSVDTTDVIGFPLRVDEAAYAEINMNATLVTASTGFTAAVTTTASATTGDVRGTYALQTASNNSDRLVVFLTPSVANLGSTTGLFGVTQF